MTQLERIVQNLGPKNGANQMFFRMFKASQYSDGFKDFMRLAECQWLYDIIESEVLSLAKRLSPDVYYFNVESIDNKGLLSLKDHTGDVFWYKNIPFTDLPEGKANFLVGWDGSKLTTCLVCED